MPGIVRQPRSRIEAIKADRQGKKAFSNADEISEGRRKKEATVGNVVRLPCRKYKPLQKSKLQDWIGYELVRTPMLDS